MLSCFSHVQFFATPWTVAHQAPLPMEFFSEEYWWVVIPFSRGSSDPGTEYTSPESPPL